MNDTSKGNLDSVLALERILDVICLLKNSWLPESEQEVGNLLPIFEGDKIIIGQQESIRLLGLSAAFLSC